MTDTERRYTQIEKEALTLIWVCEKFQDYVLGKHIDLETDHKPLVSLMSTNSLDSLPPRVLRFRLHLMWFTYFICHSAGKYIPLHCRYLVACPCLPSRGSRCPGGQSHRVLCYQCVSLFAHLSRHTSSLLITPERRPYLPATVHHMP